MWAGILAFPFVMFCWKYLRKCGTWSKLLPYSPNYPRWGTRVGVGQLANCSLSSKARKSRQTSWCPLTFNSRVIKLHFTEEDWPCFSSCKPCPCVVSHLKQSELTLSRKSIWLVSRDEVYPPLGSSKLTIVVAAAAAIVTLDSEKKRKQHLVWRR